MLEDYAFRGNPEPEAFANAARLLAVSLVLNGVASWDHRFSKEVSSFPLILLKLLEEGSEEPSEMRKSLAEVWLEATDGELLTKYCDVPFKLRKLFASEIAVVRATGKVPHNLFGFLLLLRSMIPVDTQDIEGMNSVLQTICRQAPFIHMSLACARMSIKFGQDISVRECTDMHAVVVEYMHTDEWINRHADLGIVEDHQAERKARQ